MANMGADMEVDKVADTMANMEVHEVDKEVDKLADMVAGYRCWLIGPKLFRPEPYPPTCVSSKLCEFIISGYIFFIF